MTTIRILTLILVIGCSSNYAPLDTVDQVDLERYLGTWYEIARLPNSFQEDCFCSKAEYSIIDNETIRVVNSCNKESAEGEVETSSGKAFIVEKSGNSKLRVQFFWPFRGDYWIIDLDEEDYTYSVVGTPSREYLWILARQPEMDQGMLERILKDCSEKGFPVEKMIFIDNNCK
jgi:apolipoprotein D and lipocalin family protein